MARKKQLSENSIYTHYILPSLINSGWGLQKQIRENVYFTDGRIYINGKKITRGEKKFADVVLYYKPNIPVAIIEIKKNTLSLGAGMQQVLNYGAILDIPIVFSTNGDGFIEHDRSGYSNNVETHHSLDNFPSPQQLWTKYLHYKGIKTPEAAKIAAFNYFFDPAGRKPRYYQEIAINRSVEAIANGQNRLLLVMATGTGKTYTAFQIIYRLWKSGTKKRVLFLADRNALLDQAKRNDFKHFKDKMTIIKHKEIDKAYEIYLALYQGLTNYDDNKDAYREFSRTFFDLIIVDECHRGSAADDSAWREILAYFTTATQIGLTATPKETHEISNIHYFGNPIYTYSLRQGIEDGFLAPYKVIRLGLNIDLEGWRPEQGKTDQTGQLIDDRIYNLKDYDRNLVIDERTKLVAKWVMAFLRKTNVYDKTIIFCVDIEHATRMRQAIVNEAQELVLENYKYVMKITGDDDEGKRELDNFTNSEERYPVIATTSKLMTTGIDAKTCKWIVLDANIGSMTEFKQIIGRGTRVEEEYGKLFFTIIDFRGVSNKFADKDFDGDPIMIKEITAIDENSEPGDMDIFDPPEEPPMAPPPEPKTDAKPEKPEIIDGGNIIEEPRKIYVAGVTVTVLNERVQHLDANGKLITESLKDYTRRSLLKEFSSLDSFLNRWNSSDKKKAMIEELEQHGILLENLREEIKKDLDVFDLICHIAWDKPALTRRERANNVKKRGYFSQYGEQAQKVLRALLDKYADVGIEHIEELGVLKADEVIREMGTPLEIFKWFGGKDKYLTALKNLETEIYQMAE
jgi:type I restriction enzyme R subunit